jgi:GTPase SAR1 family protein
MNLIGRDTELRIMRQHLRAGKNLAIVGPEGVGKTALVTEAIRHWPGALYCADTSTLKPACESLLAQLQITVAEADNVARKRAILDAVAGGKRWFVFDHVQHIAPRLLSLLEAIHESHPMIVVARSLAWKQTGQLKMILWDFERLKRSNPRHILELCAQAAKAAYVSTQLLDLDRRIGKLLAR